MDTDRHLINLLDYKEIGKKKKRGGKEERRKGGGRKESMFTALLRSAIIAFSELKK